MAKEVVPNASSTHEHEVLEAHNIMLYLDDDRISNMPNEVLVAILSLLTIKEAAKTGVLSRRWVNLWTCFNGSLNFDASRTMFLLYLSSQFFKEEQSKYVCWVNRVLNSLDDASWPSSILDEFRVCFDLRKDSTPFNDKWIQFCMEKKRVRRLEINFKPVCCSNDFSMGYTFPVEYFYHHIKQHPRGLYSISELTSLSLKSIGVSGQLVECFLSNCPRLERLCVVSSDQLLNLKVAVVLPQQLKLKYLKLSCNRNLKSVEISDAPNLVSLLFYGKRIEVHVENVPRLVEVSFRCCPYEGLSVINMFCSIIYSGLFSQLETLELDIHLGVDKPSFIPQFLQLTELKHLVLKVTKFNTSHLPEYEESLLEWMSLVDASPCLNKFTLQWSTAATFSGRKLREVPKCTHQCLKVVELLGFVGCEIDVEVAMYMFANANTLEKFIVDCRHPYFFGKDFRTKEQREEAKKRALDLIKILPSGVEQLVII